MYLVEIYSGYYKESYS